MMRRGGWRSRSWVESCFVRSLSMYLRHTSTTETVRFSRSRRSHSILANQAARSQVRMAISRSPAVAHHDPPVSGSLILSKLAPIAHQPHTKSEKGMTTAVESRTGRTVLLRRKRNAGGIVIAGISRVRSSGISGKIEGGGRFGFVGACSCQRRFHDTLRLSIPTPPSVLRRASQD